MLRTEAKLVLLDEPSSDLDPASQEQVLAWIFSQRGTRTVVFTTHNLAALQRADKILFMSNGAISEQGTHAELFAKHN